MEQEDESFVMGQVKRISMAWGAASLAPNSSKPKSFFQSTAFIVIIVTVVLILAATLGYVTIRSSRARRAAAGFVNLKDVSSVPLVNPDASTGQYRCIVKVIT